jgi:hypothetical protein
VPKQPDLPLRLLELLHPAGSARRIVVLGRVEELTSPATAGDASLPIDLLLLAPTSAQSRSPDWLLTASGATRQLAADGVVYVVAPWRARNRVVRLLTDASGLRVTASFAHVRERGRTRYLVEIDPNGVAYALSRSMGGRWVLRALSRHVGRLRIHRLLQLLMPMVGVTLQRSPARPLSWVFEIDSSTPAGTILVERTKHHRKRLVIYRVTRGKAVLIKIDDEPLELNREAAALDEFSPAAELAGARVPVRVSASPTTIKRPVLAQIVVPGVAASDVLGRHPRKLPDVLGKVSDWLLAWNRLTARPFSLSRDDVEQALLEPARLLQSDLGNDYLLWLGKRSRTWIGMPIPTVDEHRDLTMANVLLDRDGALGVVDWETALAGGLPLRDFFYAAADAVAATDRYAGRADSFLRTFSHDGTHQATVSRCFHRLAEGLALSPPGVELCFHACWLHHAANEARDAEADAPLPFLEIASFVASGRSFLR